MYGEDELEIHFIDKHSNDQKPKELSHALDWLIVFPGLDHFRYNGIKSMVNMLWDVYFQGIAVRFGYSSPKAQQTAQACSDLHQADQMLAAFMESGSETLAKLYSEMVRKEEQSVDGFTQFFNDHDNPNVKLLRDAVFTYSLGYFILKGGIRKCNIDYVLSGKDIMGDIFFAMNHPLYRKLYLYMDMDRATMPYFVKEQFDKTVGIKDRGYQ